MYEGLVNECGQSGQLSMEVLGCSGLLGRPGVSMPDIN